jgi:hypothetical protein
MPLVVVMALVASACGGGGKDPLEIGVKRIALDLAFADESKAGPVDRAKVLQAITVPSDVLTDFTESPPTITGRRLPPLPTPRPCPEAPPDVFPKEPVTLVIRGAPKPGLYTTHNVGTVKITDGAIPFTLPYPTTSKLEFRNVVVTPQVPGQDQAPPAVTGAVGTGNVVTFDTIETIGSTKVQDSYRYDNTNFQLVRRETTSPGRHTVLAPTPALTLQHLGKGDGDTWASAGVDQTTQTGAVVQGSIEKREFVDVCGQRYDAWKVPSTESTANLNSGEHSETEPNLPNVYHFANDIGGLMIQRDIHSSETVNVEGKPITVQYDFVSTFDSVDPVGP